MLRVLAICYIQIVQGTPLLVILFVFFFGLPIFGFPVLPWIAAAAAFFALCRRVSRRNLARRAAGDRAHAMGSGCIPGARLRGAASLRHRSATGPGRDPPTVGFLVQLIKNTSLAPTIGFVELTREGQLTTASTFQPFTVYITVVPQEKF